MLIIIDMHLELWCASSVAGIHAVESSGLNVDLSRTPLGPRLARREAVHIYSSIQVIYVLKVLEVAECRHHHTKWFHPRLGWPWISEEDVVWT
jgi:hypothetical protein